MRQMRVSLLMLLLLAIAVFPQQKKFSGRLETALNQTEQNEYVRTLVIFSDQVDIQKMDARFYAEKASLEERTYTVITTLKKQANQSQADMINFLTAKEASEEVFSYKPFYIVNAIMVEAKPHVIYDLATRDEVHMIDLDAELTYDKPVAERADDAVEAGRAGVEPGVKIINAHLLWEIGLTGQGRIVMGIDTGVDETHPALSHKWRGNHVPVEQAWFDPTGGASNPDDCDGHGTHTMGTMTGYVDGGDTVGVAIGAEWIASNSLCGGSPHTSNSIASFEWAMNPDGDINTISDMPDAITNSWWDPAINDECDNVWVNTLNAVEAVGIAAVFSAGNSGPGASTITTPKNINTNTTNVWATAAINGANYLSGSNDPIASFSSRGPSVCDGEGPLKIKPEASAPGDDVRSSVPGGGYGFKSGTSMAAPHVTGAIALLKQFAPTLTGKQIKEALYATASDLGADGEDNTYGVGLIDVYAAWISLGEPDDTPPEPIVDLMASTVSSSELELSWTVPVDTSVNGVTSFDIRMSDSPINDTSAFYSAEQVPFTKLPNTAGETETIVIDNLDFSTQKYFAIISLDIWSNTSELSNSADATTYAAPVMVVTPDEISNFIPEASTLTDTFTIMNDSQEESTLDFMVTLDNNTFPSDAVEVKLVPRKKAIEAYSDNKDKPVTKGGVAIEGFGGPDMYGYEWIDSDEDGGPAYVFNDISATGTEVTDWQATSTFDPLDEGMAGPIDIGFDFKFYGMPESQVYLGTNGFVTFAPFSGSTFTNDEIPNADVPNGLIAAVWDDLDGDGGACYTQQFADKFVIQYTNWPEYFGSGTYTFQVVLWKSGKIHIAYESISGDVNSATVGIENQDGTDGLQVDYNASYMAEGKLVQFAAEPDWLTPDVSEGRIFSQNEVDVVLEFRSEDFPGGIYTMDLVVTGNDPNNLETVIPVTMVLGEGDGPWTADITISDNGGLEASAGLGFGQAGMATDGIDTELGEAELPPVPPTGVFDARFNLPTEAASYLDLRSFIGDTVVWNMSFQPGSAGYPFTLTWDPAELPAGVFKLTDQIGGSVYNVDMKEVSELVVDNAGVNSLKITLTKDMTVGMTVDAGWNLLSVPMPQPDMTVANMFPEATSVAYGYNDGYQVHDMFTMSKGYWLKFDAGSAHDLNGEPQHHAVHVMPGWNIIGSTYKIMPVAGITSDANVDITSQFFGFEGGYSAASDIVPGKGYWVKVSEEGNLYFEAMPVAKDGKETANLASTEGMSLLSLTDANGNQKALYLADNLSNKGLFELPPAPPAGIFDARFATGYMAEDMSAPNTIVLSGAQYPVVLNSLDTELSVQLSDGSNVITENLEKGGSLTIRDNKFNRITVQSTIIPAEFVLEQNYPNPFNPSTNIKFSLPADAKVTLTVYNTLGQVVTELTSQNYAAGNHSIKFNASEIASGMYIYSLKAESVDGLTYNSIKKMMLMK